MNAPCRCGLKMRGLKTAGSTIPGVIALLLPKCPLCLAAWIAAGTGVAVPAALAGSIRPALGIACALLLGGIVLMRRSKTRSAIGFRRP